MAIFSKGADPEALDASASRLDGHAAELARIDDNVRTSLVILTAGWVGGDADAAAVAGRYLERAVAAAAARLRSTSEILRQQARQQRTASAGGPATSAPPVRTRPVVATSAPLSPPSQNPAPLNLVGGPMLPDGGPSPQPPSPVAGLTAAQVAAFTAAVGDPPVTANDATTAAMLDPTTQQAKYQGMSSVIKTFPITPRPGVGVVRVNLFIPGESVFNLDSMNLGDNRDFDPHAAPDASRVTLYVDYDNGVVVARQNPSDSTDLMTQALGPTDVAVGTPSVGVYQADDGRIAIGYEATDPFALAGTGDLGWSVNGDMIIDPGTNGAPMSVSGTRGDFPSLEVYSTSTTGDTSTLYQYRATGSAFGPMTALPFHGSYGSPRPDAPWPTTPPTVVTGVVPTPSPTATPTPTAVPTSPPSAPIPPTTPSAAPTPTMPLGPTPWPGDGFHPVGPGAR